MTEEKIEKYFKDYLVPYFHGDILVQKAVEMIRPEITAFNFKELKHVWIKYKLRDDEIVRVSDAQGFLIMPPIAHCEIEYWDFYKTNKDF